MAIHLTSLPLIQSLAVERQHCMMLELHILGPAFGLPSIDPECNAAVAFLQQTLTPNNIGWKLVPDHDASASPSGGFPLLWDDTRSVVGFTSIVKYIGATYSDISSSDEHLSTQKRADSIAFTAFLTSTALPLLDLSLYTTFENYYSLTRPAFSSILPWHANYVIPPLRRDAARARTQHLGLASLDIDTVHDDFARLEGAGGASNSNSISGQYEATKKVQERSTVSGRQAPSLLPLGRKKLSSLLSSPQHADRFKLDMLANELFEPLSAQLGNKKFLLDDERPSSIDCLAFGYLALMLCPDYPQSWLKDTIKKRFPKLQRYTDDMGHRYIGKDPISAECVIKGNTSSSPLPWQLPAPPSVARTATSISREILHTFPISQTLSSIGLHFPPGTTGSTTTRLLNVSSFVFSVLLGVAYHFATIKPDSWDFIFKASDFDSEPGSSKIDAFAADPNATLAALEQFNSSLELNASQEREKERMGGTVVGAVDVDIEVD
ncbi:hypothetical protein NA57DRAFT_71385 [Rhizodiscina lignyota]|uniref:Mitochondrial outer membrane transport complex Sam37/metaxin N-terminal domain-containing protein n=1 Tax=Rhizodiscina lignyota TaxID=1504668 RepID=A0A9P4ME95_9PEZI|nr:hypothetical protein NA57DRAFT_71385 [Rhizodiscina lignyota]